MRVGIIHPTVWPDVRRGTERFIHEYAEFLATRGHEIRVFAASDGPPRKRREGAYVIEYGRRLWRPWMERLGLHEYHVFPLTVLAALLGEKLDAVHCFNFTDALAAEALRSFTGAPVLLHLANLPPQVEYRRVASTGGRLLKLAVKHADQALAVSRFQRDYFVQRTGNASIRLIPPPVDTEAFRPPTEKGPDTSTILFASAAFDRRKGIRVLFRAFEKLKRTGSPARLKIASSVGDELQRELLSSLSVEFHDDVEFLGVTPKEGFPALLGSASVVALPSMWEAFPLVVMESLSVGTPVVGTNQGGIPELLTDSRTGVLFEPGEPNQGEPSNAEGLAEALTGGLKLSRDPATSHACRAVAERLSWSALGPQYEELLQEVRNARLAAKAERAPARRTTAT